MYKISINSYVSVYYNQKYSSFVLDNSYFMYHWLTLKKNILCVDSFYFGLGLGKISAFRNLYLSLYGPHISVLDIIGLGYRFFLTQSLIKLKIGLSHFIYVSLNKFISIKFLSKTKILFFSVFKNKLDPFTNFIYKFKFPNKYKRKGFFLNKKYNKLRVGKVFVF